MTETNKGRGKQVRWAGAAGLLAVGAVAGGVLAGTLSANAAGSTPSPTSSSSSSTESPPANFPAHGTAAHEDQETAVTGANAAKAQAAAIKASGGGTAGAVTTDFTGTGYEVTVTKSDGSSAEVHLDQNFTVAGPMGFGHGGPMSAG